MLLGAPDPTWELQVYLTFAKKCVPILWFSELKMLR